MQDFFTAFHNQVKQRINRYKKLYSFGEDSIRYDFYHTALTSFQLIPSDIVLEQPIPPSQFTSKERDQSILKQGRHTDKPEFDLRIDSNSYLPKGMLVEFAFFRKTEISSNQDKSGRHGKLINEIHRLALLKHYENKDGNSVYKDFSKYSCLLVCVMDEEMINYGHNERGRAAIPVQKTYELSHNYVKQFPDTVQNCIDKRFLDKSKSLKIMPTAKRIFDETEAMNQWTPKWSTWIWEVDYKNID